jgi:predicted nucleotidyltransferase
MHSLLENNKAGIIALCEKYNVNKLFAFGSIVTGKFSTNNSDIDFYVELMPMVAFDRGQALIELWDHLEGLFDRKIDLVTDQPIRNHYFLAELEKTKQLIYDREKQEIFI